MHSEVHAYGCLPNAKYSMVEKEMEGEGEEYMNRKQQGAERQRLVYLSLLSSFVIIIREEEGASVSPIWVGQL